MEKEQFAPRQPRADWEEALKELKRFALPRPLVHAETVKKSSMEKINELKPYTRFIEIDGDFMNVIFHPATDGENTTLILSIANQEPFSRPDFQTPGKVVPDSTADRIKSIFFDPHELLQSMTSSLNTRYYISNSAERIH